MALYKVKNNRLEAVPKTTFAQQSLKERTDLQRMLKDQVGILAPDTLVVAEEFGQWQDSRHRIDLLAIDKQANLVVIELKRTDDGGYMELQAIRYAAMISTLTFEKLVPIYAQYLRNNNMQDDASENLLRFLEWTEADEDGFAKEVKIILASADFNSELMSSVMWLNDFGLDIRCVRMRPHVDNGETLLDIQTVIPLPEAADYQVGIREKRQKEREQRTLSRDLTKYNVSVAGKFFAARNKRWMMFDIISQVLWATKNPEAVMKIFPRDKMDVYEGTLNAEQVAARIMEKDTGGVWPRTRRFFVDDGEFFHFNGKTYVLSNQWSIHTALPVIDALSKMYPDLQIEIKPVE